MFSPSHSSTYPPRNQVGYTSTLSFTQVRYSLPRNQVGYSSTLPLDQVRYSSTWIFFF